MNKEERIYPSMVIRSQAETIKLLEQENNQLKEEHHKQIEEYQKACDEVTSDKMDLENILKELRSWLEVIKTMYENEYKDVDTAEHYNSVLSKLNELEGGKNER